MARTVPATNTHIPGDLIKASVWNSGPKALNDFLSNRPMFRGLFTGSASAASGTWTAVPMNVTYIDTDGGHNTGVNNTRYTCQVAGTYWVKGSVAWNGGSGIPLNRSDTAIAKNGTIWVGSGTFLDWGPGPSITQGAFTTSALISLGVGDYVEVWGRQSSGFTTFFDQGSSLSRSYCDLSAAWVSQ